MSYGLSNT
jgi:hypothetical protein